MLSEKPVRGSLRAFNNGTEHELLIVYQLFFHKHREYIEEPSVMMSPCCFRRA
jgi:hypothetical protein